MSSDHNVISFERLQLERRRRQVIQNYTTHIETLKAAIPCQEGGLGILTEAVMIAMERYYAHLDEHGHQRHWKTVMLPKFSALTNVEPLSFRFYNYFLLDHYPQVHYSVADWGRVLGRLDFAHRTPMSLMSIDVGRQLLVQKETQIQATSSIPPMVFFHELINALDRRGFQLSGYTCSSYPEELMLELFRLPTEVSLTINLGSFRKTQKVLVEKTLTVQNDPHA